METSYSNHTNRGRTNVAYIYQIVSVYWYVLQSSYNHFVYEDLKHQLTPKN